MKWATTRPAAVRARADAADAEGKGQNVTNNPWEEALTEFERKSLQAYRTRFPGMSYSLTQNGATGFAMHSTEEFMHTLIRNAGLIWSDGLANESGEGQGEGCG